MPLCHGLPLNVVWEESHQENQVHYPVYSHYSTTKYFIVDPNATVSDEWVKIKQTLTQPCDFVTSVTLSTSCSSHMDGIVRTNKGLCFGVSTNWQVFNSCLVFFSLCRLLVSTCGETFWQGRDFPLLLSGGFNVGEGVAVSPFSSPGGSCEELVVTWWSDPSGLCMGVGTGVRDKNPDPPTTTVLLKNIYSCRN